MLTLLFIIADSCADDGIPYMNVNFKEKDEKTQSYNVESSADNEMAYANVNIGVENEGTSTTNASSSADREIPYMNVQFDKQEIKPSPKPTPKTRNRNPQQDELSPTKRVMVDNDIETSTIDEMKDKKLVPKPKPIKIEKLADYIAKHKDNSSEGFKAEFKVRNILCFKVII